MHGSGSKQKTEEAASTICGVNAIPAQESLFAGGKATFPLAMKRSANRVGALRDFKVYF